MISFQQRTGSTHGMHPSLVSTAPNLLTSALENYLLKSLSKILFDII